MPSAATKGKKPQSLAVPRTLPSSTAARRQPAPSKGEKSKPSAASTKSKPSAATTNSKASSMSTCAPFTVPLSSSSAPSSDSILPRDSSPSPQAQSSSSSSAPASTRERPHDQCASEDDKTARKIKWQNILEVMQHNVETRKVSKEIDSFHDLARLIPRVVNPFIDPLAAFMVGRARTQPDADTNPADYCDSDSEDSDEEISEEELRNKQERSHERAQQRELLHQYDALLNLIPDLSSDVDLLDDEDIDTLAAYIKYDAGKARTTDFNHVSERIWKYIAMSGWFPDTPVSLEKWQCGWEGYHTAALLCPPPLHDLFKKDWFCNKVKDPESDITIVADDWPLALFDMDALYSADQLHGPLSGFLRSKLFKLMFQSIWTGPISTKCDGARGKSTPGKPPLSHKYRINDVSPRMLAYVAVLLRHALTTAEWKMSDLQFNNSDFFDKIVALFEEPPTPWASETLEWWNKEIFGTVSRTPQADPGRKTIAELAREHHKAVRRAMKAGLDPLQVTRAKKRSLSLIAEDPDVHPEPVASSSKRRRSADPDEDTEVDADTGSRRDGSLSPQDDAEYEHE
ncbi:hypothetical protein C8Q80DRAFT_822650 [Daedaleopsis nitida]|nr:hypothetical protein C8Q80DRAFT_822650 [Daedaleopsis nitida]